MRGVSTLCGIMTLEDPPSQAVRGIAWAPSDLKFVTASDDTFVKVWDFLQCRPETTLKGHGGDVKWGTTK